MGNLLWFSQLYLRKGIKALINLDIIEYVIIYFIQVN